MSTLIAVVLVVLVVAGGLTPALAGELEARQRAARDATWVATRAKFEAIRPLGPEIGPRTLRIAPGGAILRIWDWPPCITGRDVA